MRLTRFGAEGGHVRRRWMAGARPGAAKLLRAPTNGEPPALPRRDRRCRRRRRRRRRSRSRPLYSRAPGPWQIPLRPDRARWPPGRPYISPLLSNIIYIYTYMKQGNHRRLHSRCRHHRQIYIYIQLYVVLCTHPPTPFSTWWIV